MIAFSFLEFFTELRNLIQSVWFSFERLPNFLNQNIGLSNISFDDWLMFRQTSTSSSAKLPKIFSARCTNPGVFKIFSMGLISAMLFECCGKCRYFENPRVVMIWNQQSNQLTSILFTHNILVDNSTKRSNCIGINVLLYLVTLIEDNREFEKLF